MAIPAQKWTSEEVSSDSVTKKDIIEYIQSLATLDFLKDHKLNGKLATLAKNSKKPALIKAYNDLFKDEKNFQGEDGPSALDEYKKEKAMKDKMHAEAEKKHKDAVIKARKDSEVEEEVKYTKVIITKGEKDKYPIKGDLVKCFYTGKLPDGKVFDTNIGRSNRKKIPLQFKVGTGKVIRGWDEALLTMTRGETAEITIEPEWAYGFKGLPEAGIPPNSKLIFEVTLDDIE